MDDEFEIGLELDRALRAAVTGVAQVMERGARRLADSDRSTAAAARQDWLSERDAARRQYEPWRRPGAVEKAPTAVNGLAAAQAWAAAAAWSEMDPTAAAAERELAERIGRAHGAHPAELLKRADGRASAVAIALPERADLADVVDLDEERARWEAWATTTGAAAEFDVDRWRDSDGTIDEAARDAALVRLWDAGSQERALLELEEHQAAMTAAGLGALPAHLEVTAPSAGADASASVTAREPVWARLLAADAFEAADPQDVAQAWRRARTQGLEGRTPDLAAQAAADQLARAMNRKYAKHPETLLRETLAQRAAAATESRRDAEDVARAACEVADEGADVAALDEPAPAPYDRSTEADLDALTLQSKQARVASSHGFSQSTADLLAQPTRSSSAAVGATRGGWGGSKRSKRPSKR